MSRNLLGFHAVEEALRKNSSGRFYYSKSNKRIKEMINIAEKRGFKVSQVSEKQLDQLSGQKNNRGILLQLNEKAQSSTLVEFDSFIREEHSDNSMVILLDGITDPHNLGAVLRSADQFEADLVVIPAKRSARDNETVAKTSAGASHYVPFSIVSNLVKAVEALQGAGYWVYGADMGGSYAHEADLTGKVALVMGSEGKGVSSLLRKKCDNLIAVPAGGNVDSFNVSVAAGILMYDIRRQQGFPDLT